MIDWEEKYGKLLEKILNDLFELEYDYENRATATFKNSFKNLIKKYKKLQKQSSQTELKSGHLLSSTYVIRKKDLPCEKGYVEIITLLDKNNKHSELTINICADESKNHRFNIKKLNQTITEKSEKIIDLYIWKDDSEWFKERGFKLKKGINPTFRHLDRETAFKLFKEEEIKIEYIYQ